MPACVAVHVFLLQGVFVKRHQVDKQDGGRFSPPDLAVGQTVTVYGRTYVLVDADTFTRKWWVKLLRQPDAAENAYKPCYSYWPEALNKTVMRLVP